MTDDKQPDPQGPPPYLIIRDLAAELVGVFDAVRFEPLFGRHPGTVSVVALMSRDHLAGHHDMWLNLWHGYRDGLGEDGSEERLWLRIDQHDDHRAGDRIQALNPDKADFGLDLPDAGSRGEVLSKGIGAMLTLLKAAMQVHRTQTDMDLTFGVLNQGIEEGVEGSRPGPDGARFDETSGLVSELEQLCAESDLDAVEFGQYGPSGTPLATRTFLDVGDQLTMTMWSDESGFDWVDVAGSVQRMDTPEIVFPGADQDEADEVAVLAQQLEGIHDAALTIFEILDAAEPGIAFDLLNSVAYAAMNGAMEEAGPHARPWHKLADHFGEHCRLGFLAGVMLEESPFGNLNIRASTIDPATRKTTDLQVYWKQDDEQDEPEHWLSVGTITGPAHDVDPEYPDLLAATPEGSRDYIRHAIDHLHEMVHLAGSVLEARTGEVFAFVDARKVVEEVPDAVEHEMFRSTIEDAITGLNGIARLYTGAMPG